MKRCEHIMKMEHILLIIVGCVLLLPVLRFLISRMYLWLWLNKCKRNKDIQAYKDASPNQLVLMNEIFQSTTYSEGREALINIIKALVNKGVDIMSVTFFSDMNNIVDGQISVNFTEAHNAIVHIQKK